MRRRAILALQLAFFLRADCLVKRTARMAVPLLIHVLRPGMCPGFQPTYRFAKRDDQNVLEFVLLVSFNAIALAERQENW